MMRWLCLLSFSALVGCFPRGPALEGDVDPDACDEEFDDHTHVGAMDVDTFQRLLENSVSEREQRVDFLVTSVARPALRRVRFEDGSFFSFHDEWYWFRLLNGVSACGSSANPIALGTFETIDEIYAFLADDEDLPLDLARTADGRIVSPSFYELSLRTSPRVYGPGTLFRYVGPQDGWAFEVAFVDAITAEDLRSVHATVEAALPAGGQLFWRAVSPAHNALADALETGGDEQLRGRILRVGEEPRRADQGSCCAAMSADATWLACGALTLLLRMGRARRSRGEF